MDVDRKAAGGEPFPEVSDQLLRWIDSRFPDACPALPAAGTPDIAQVIALQVARQAGRRDVLEALRTRNLDSKRRT